MKKIAFIFPGQGSQYAGMGREFFNNYESARNIFNKADEVLGFNLREKIFNGAEEELQKTEITQPAVFTTSIACLEVIKEKGISAVMVAGHSLGEYSAVAATGAMSFSDCLRLVIKRGQFIKEASEENHGTMAAIIGLSPEQVKKVCGQINAESEEEHYAVQPVNFNSPIQVVISGTEKGCEKALNAAKSAGAKRVMMLKVSGPFHHKQFMEPARKKLITELEKYRIEAAGIPLVANYTASPVVSGNDIKEALINQINSPVLWEASILRMVKEGIEVFIETGPGRVLTGLIKRITDGAVALNVEDEKSLSEALNSI